MAKYVLVSYFDLQYLKVGTASPLLSALKDTPSYVKVLFDARQLRQDSLMEAVSIVERHLRTLGFPDGTLYRVSLDPTATTICGSLGAAASDCEVWQPRNGGCACPLSEKLRGQIRFQTIG
jgi:hypothetical protein